jgi:hypothetical protein
MPTSSDGTEKNQTCHDEGPVTLDRSRTVDEEISTKVIDYLDRNDPKKPGKPIFIWYNPALMLWSICFMPASLMPQSLSSGSPVIASYFGDSMVR